jgi:YD repeat-containing protein
VVDFDVTSDVVEDLSFGSTVSGVGQVNAPDSTNWDCAIGDLTFLLGTSQQNPFVRETADFRRQRIDTERNPGEQSIDSGYWVRSQPSWHYGSGLSTAEPLEANEEESQFRYKEGGGVNPWTAGELTLLHETASVHSSSATNMSVLGVQTGILFREDAVLTYIDNAGTATAVTWGGTGNIGSMTDTGQYYLVSNDTGIYRGDLPSGTGTLIYNNKSTPSYTLIRWIKSRVMYADGVDIHEITDLTPSSASLPTALFSHPNSDWEWTDFADGPTSIYVSGYSLENSAIYRIGISTTATTTTLSQPVIVAEMPRGEDILSMYSYVGSFLIIGTTNGVRVASINDDGSLTIGPLVVTDAPVDDAVAFGSFVYVTTRDKGNAGDRTQRAGLFRIDLGQTLNNNPLNFAHAADLTIPSSSTATGNAVSVTTSDDKIWFCVTGTDGGVFKQQDTFVDSGWIETGRIRLGTVEKKGWRDIRLLSKSGFAGTSTAYASTTEEGSPSTWSLAIIGSGENNDITGKLNVAAPSPEPNLYLAFNLQKDTATGETAKLIGYQLRAVPAPERTRLLSVPIMLFDFVTDRKGLKIGRTGFAWDTLQKLQQLEEDSVVVQWRDFTTGEAATVYVERVSFTRMTPPTNRVSGVGGIATALLRIV